MLKSWIFRKIVFPLNGNGQRPDTLRDAESQHLLRRDTVQIDLEPVRRELAGKSVLVTGAGGSIGSELCWHLSRLGISHLTMVERSEYHLYRLCQAFKEKSVTTLFTPILSDIRDERQIDRVFSKHCPYLVLHAAAYKHLPFIELFPEEAVKNNIFATRALAQFAEAHRVARFLMISTDKAVRPTSVMGVTKRVAEMVVQALDHQSQTKFMTVRFGNVLASDGSVTEKFKERIARRLPLPVTHPQAERFFITVTEAVKLSLLAGVMGNSAEIYMLEMGAPVRIIDLATDMIRLAGLRPGIDIPITYTGLRPGEKLSEELLREKEDVTRSIHAKILAVKSAPVEGVKLEVDLEALHHLVLAGDGEAIKAKLQEMVPDYRPHVGRISVLDV